ncbi:MAG TPA: BREX-1 system phosphatase PglZ type A [Syntrophales bacterium]|nr:BREX-1 system phosphatase PglZ type A [Syntrophales bacterium]
MISSQITDRLRRIFTEEGQRLVFWNDGNREFEESLDALALPDVRILRLDKTGPLEVKALLELEDPSGKYLIYAPFPEPHIDDDWLIDMRLYSRTFRADRASIVLDELGLANQALRSHLEKRQAFFRNQERLERIKKWVRPNDLEGDLDLKMMAALARAEQPNAFGVLMKLFEELAAEENRNMLIPPPRAWDDIEKYDLASPFWDLMAKTFGYTESNPTLADLLICLLVTDFAQGLKGDCPQPLRHFLLPERSLALNASVFLSQWRSNINHYATYNALSHKMAEELKIDEHINALDEDALMEVMTFESVERHIVRCLRDHLPGKGGFNLSTLKDGIRQRRDGYWAGPLFVTSEKGNDYQATYNAIETAGELLKLRESHLAGLSYASAEKMYLAYIGELFRYDQLYRQFQEAADQVELRGWDILKDLRGIVEDCYSWSIDQTAMAWGSFVDQGKDNGLLYHWSIKDIHKQHDFYHSHVAPLLKSSPLGKAYVIISDAFRYEAAEELSREINGRYRFQATLDSQLGVLPSYTGLGMAALLPHSTIEYKLQANIDVIVDGQATASIEQRAKILSPIPGTAIKAEELTAMNKDQGREFVKPWRVIYIYHNQIDTVGDSAASEFKTFNAVRTAMKDISALISFVINNLNGSHVIVTADHGFMFQEKVPEPADKSGLDAKPPGTLKAKKRYLLGTDLGDGKNVWHGDTQITAGTKNSMEFWIPKGANRFHFTGGARYIHGGAMLQEIVVPVMTVKELTGQAKEKSVIRKVDVSLLGALHKVVNNVQRFDFIQTDAVSERVLSRTLAVSLRDGDELISNEVSLTFDSRSSSMDDRKKSARLMVKAGQYDKKREYALVLRDAETTIEYLRIPMTIDLTFINDF